METITDSNIYYNTPKLRDIVWNYVKRTGKVIGYKTVDLGLVQITKLDEELSSIIARHKCHNMKKAALAISTHLATSV